MLSTYIVEIGAPLVALVDGLMRRGTDLGAIEALPAQRPSRHAGCRPPGYLLDPDNNVFGLISAVLSDGTPGMGGGA